MKRKTMLFGLPLLLVLLAVASYQLMNSRTFQLFGGLTSQVETKECVVALTFDDGPTQNTSEILSLLDRYNAKATFFLIGSDLEQHMEEGRSIAAAGHQIGNHTYSHKRMIFKSLSFIEQEIESTNALIREAGYEGDILFRPPNGKKLVGLPYVLAAKQMRTITWNLEPDTYDSAASDQVDYVASFVEPGSIILLHPMYDRTGNALQAIEGILAALTDQGYTFVTVHELLESAER